MEFIILLFFISLKLISTIKVNKDNLISYKLCKSVLAMIVSNSYLIKTLIKLYFQFEISSFLFRIH